MRYYVLLNNVIVILRINSRTTDALVIVLTNFHVKYKFWGILRRNTYFFFFSLIYSVHTGVKDVSKAKSHRICPAGERLIFNAPLLTEKISRDYSLPFATPGEPRRHSVPPTVLALAARSGSSSPDSTRRRRRRRWH